MSVFANNMGKNFGKSISKNVGGKHSPGMLATCQKRFNHAKQSDADVHKTTF